MNRAAPDRRRLIWPVAKWILFVVLLYFVGKRAVALWQSSPPMSLHVDGRWAVPAAVLYLIGWFPSIWFWRSMMRQMGQRLDWYQATRAYFISQLGKYVPGKAMVLVIRGALVKQSGGSPILAVMTTVYETLVFMYTAVAIAMALAPRLIPDGLWERTSASFQVMRQQPLLVPAVVVVVTFASTPFSSWLFTQIGRKAAPKGATSPACGISAGHVLQGVLSSSLGWICNALSLGCTLQAISAGQGDLAGFPIWLASVTLSTFAGFVILIAPGGLGIREWVLVEMLKDQPGVGGEKAVVAAGLLRLIWFVTEIVIASILYVIKPKEQE